MPLLLVTYASETAPTGQRVAVIVSGSLGSAIVAVALMAAYAGIRWAHSRRRYPWAWVAIRALDAASKESAPSILTLGIGNRDESLAIRLPQGIINFVNEGDLFLALQSHTRERLGLVEVREIYEDSCICIVFDKTDHEEFWEELENRMNRDFSPPSGVEFSRSVNQDSFDLVRRQIRNWAG